MKRFILLITVVIILIASLILTASATVYEEVFSYEFTQDYTTTLRDTNGAVNFLYNGGWFGTEPNAYTGMDMPSGGIGSVFVFIACQDIEARSSDSNTVANNKVQCDIALEWVTYATKTRHVAARGANGVTNGWDYTYVSNDHDRDTGPQAEIIIPDTFYLDSQ